MTSPVPATDSVDVTAAPCGVKAPASRFPRGRSLSLRARLMGLLALLVTAALIVLGALTAQQLRSQLIERLDNQLQTSMNSNGPGPSTLIGFRSSAGVYWLTDTRGPGGLGDGEDDSDRPSTAATEALTTQPQTVSGKEGSTFRAVARSSPIYRSQLNLRYLSDEDMTAVTVICDDECTLVYALPMTDAEATWSTVLVRFTLFSLAVLVAMMVIAYYAIGRAFRPLREVESVAIAFGEGDTSRRVTEVVPGTEVGRLGESMNGMLDQIETTLAAREASEQRMRRFVGDASHELRTPLSTLKGFAELYRMGAVQGQDNISQTFRRIEDESTRMSVLVEDLLRLARLDEKRPLNLTSVDLLVLASDAEHDATALAPDRVVRVTGLDGAPQPGAGLVTGDEQQLRQVVTNLMANAIRHTPAGSPVELGVGTRGQDVIFQVVDHGVGVPAELAEKIFERFFRADSSRSRGTGGGSGLGLAIVSSIVSAHHGTAEVRPTPGGGATFEVRLPARRALSAHSQVQLSSPSARSR